nr:hypothetical protein Iba_scaffold11949CG0010 [Ipomoea batatas]
MNPFVNYNGRPILKFKLGQFVCVLLEHTKRQPIQFFPATETSLCACLLIGALTARSWGPKPIVHQQPQKGKKKPKMKSGNGLNKSMVPLEPGWVRAALRFFVVRFYPAIARPIYRRGTPMLVALRKVVDRRSRVSFPGGVLGPNGVGQADGGKQSHSPPFFETHLNPSPSLSAKPLLSPMLVPPGNQLHCHCFALLPPTIRHPRLQVASSTGV